MGVVMSKASSKVIIRGRAPRNVAEVQNSDPLGRSRDNVENPEAYFGLGRARRSRGTSMCGLRPSFFAMLRNETPAPTKEK